MKKTKAKKAHKDYDTVPKITSIRHLRQLCNEGNQQAQKLAMDSAANLGALSSETTTWEKAIGALEQQAMALECEYDDMDAEQNVTDEINFVREL